MSESRDISLANQTYEVIERKHHVTNLLKNYYSVKQFVYFWFHKTYDISFGFFATHKYIVQYRVKIYQNFARIYFINFPVFHFPKMSLLVTLYPTPKIKCLIFEVWSGQMNKYYAYIYYVFAYMRYTILVEIDWKRHVFQQWLRVWHFMWIFCLSVSYFFSAK